MPIKCISVVQLKGRPWVKRVFGRRCANCCRHALSVITTTLQDLCRYYASQRESYLRPYYSKLNIIITQKIWTNLYIPGRRDAFVKRAIVAPHTLQNIYTHTRIK
jgi:hypothetical protein